ncbi:MAG TPA: DNA polymerase Y family protein [Tepidisphaeraceae bacterium]|nr:DNA polymerase Y family protein [Tepidisphaeraceae bacterium]
MKLNLRPSPSPCDSAPNQPLAVVRTIADRQVIVALSPEAAALGVRSGMTLTQARALCAHVRHAEHQPLRDNRSLQSLARWLMRFSPVVALAHPQAADPSAQSPRSRSAKKEKDLAPAPISHAVFLDITGCDRLFGGVENLVGQIRDSIGRLHIAARVAVAPTPGAAWAIATAGQDGAIVSPERLAAVLSPLPPAALRLNDDLVAALHHLGLATIGQLIHLPRDVLPARFGAELLHRLDQALGNIPEPLVPLEHPAPVESKMDFDGPVSSLEAIHQVSRRLLEDITRQLTSRGNGARQLDIELTRAYADPVKKSISLSHPSRNARSLFNLIQCALEDLQAPQNFALPYGRVGKKTKMNSKPASPILHDDGFLSVALRIPLLQRLSEEQIFLLDQDRQIGQLEVGRLIDRLRLRLGEGAASQVELVESHLPEKAWGKVKSQTRILDIGTKSETRNPKNEKSNLSHDICAVRPFHLLASPAEVRVMVTPSDAIEGRPAAFVYAHCVHPVTCWAGPERIAGCWWDGHDKIRDYFEVEDPSGRRFWIFRVAQTAKWYLHGSYA